MIKQQHKAGSALRELFACIDEACVRASGALNTWTYPEDNVTGYFRWEMWRKLNDLRKEAELELKAFEQARLLSEANFVGCDDIEKAKKRIIHSRP